MPTLKLELPPVKHNLRVVLRGMRDYSIHRENGITILTIRIGNETIIIEVPP